MRQPTNRPCNAPDCDQPIGPKGAKGFCPKHYRMLPKSDLGQCSDPECDQPARTKGLCGTHYHRKRFGLPMGRIERRVTHRAGALCVGPECVRTSVKRGLCESHYHQVQSGRELSPLTYTRGDPRECAVCGARNWPPNGRRVTCSAICFYYWQLYGGPPPATLECVLCGVEIDLNARTLTGRRRNITVKLCKRCRTSRSLRHKMPVAVLAKRDGTACGICGDPVDLSLRKPDLFSPSVDHIIPRARGGSNEPENLQLAHLWCNHVKSDRIGFTI